MKKIYILLLLVILLSLTGCKDKKVENNTTNNTVEETILSEETIEAEKTKEEKNLYTKTKEEFYKIYGEDYEFNIPEDEGYIQYSIDLLVKTKGFDASFLEEEGCDIEGSYIGVFDFGDGIQGLSINLDCYVSENKMYTEEEYRQMLEDEKDNLTEEEYEEILKSIEETE